ncbi:MAG: NAD(P)H-binding protein [Nakamurella sp.]
MQSRATPILVTGGTGTLGRLVVEQLIDAGRTVRVLSRNPHDNVAGVEYVVGTLGTADGRGAGAGAGDGVGHDDGIDAAVDGINTVIHCAGSSKGDADKARTLVRAATAAGVSHLVYISVVGADRIPVVSRLDRAMFGYFESKLAAEQIVADSGIPFTTLRATQFHDLVLTAMQAMTKMPVVPAPVGFRLQPVDAGDVATRLTELALGQPAGLVPDLGGPRTYQFGDLVRGYLQATHRRRMILPLPMPGKAAAAFRAGGNLAPDHADGRRTWEEFLADRLGVQVNAMGR